MRRIRFIVLLIVVVVQGCDGNNDDDCNLLCFTPPRTFVFDVVDKTSGENLFTNGTYQTKDLRIMDTKSDAAVNKFTFSSENDINLVQLSEIGWETEIVDLKFAILEKQIFTLYVDAERKSEDCCSFTEYNEITIGGSEFEFNSNDEIYTILVE